jgi:hypothetical protein
MDVGIDQARKDKAVLRVDLLIGSDSRARLQGDDKSVDYDDIVL